jgi:hypothetical protein
VPRHLECIIEAISERLQGVLLVNRNCRSLY